MPARPSEQDGWVLLVRQFVQRREALGLSQDDVAERVGCTSTLVSKWECFERRPRGFLLQCWAQSLGCVLQLCPSPTER